jgi:hypothetical protein
MTSEWFAGDGRDENEEVFLAELRGCAETHGLLDATPEDTALHVWDGAALFAVIALPGLQDDAVKPVLEVAARFAGEPGLMCGVETHGYLADAYDLMDLAGVDRTPRALGRHAFEWFTQQLRRPVERATWTTWLGTRSLIRFVDDGELISWDVAAHRRRDRVPDRVVRLR